jgi:hypothetical protein
MAPSEVAASDRESMVAHQVVSSPRLGQCSSPQPPGYDGGNGRMMADGTAKEKWEDSL